MATPQKRPRLSLKIQTSVGPVARVSRPPTIDTKDPTAFNTLSNAYASVVGRSGLTGSHAEPLTAINTLQNFSLATPIEKPDPSNRANTPYTTHYPETPLSAHPTSAHPGSPRRLEINYPSTMTATPPLSGTTDSNEARVFTFAATDIAHGKLAHRLYDNTESLNTKPRTIVYQPSAPSGLQPPYTPSQVRHSILRNSPLPAKTAIPPPSPRRQSLRLQEKAARRVGYNSPLEQEITTNTYTRSHIDLLSEDASPLSPFSPSTPGGAESVGVSPLSDSDALKKAAITKSAVAASPIGIRKRKNRREKPRRWVWTIGKDDEEVEIEVPTTSRRAEAATPKVRINGMEDMTPIGPPIPQIALPQAPIRSIELPSDGSNDQDVEMTDGSSVASFDTESLHSVEHDMDIAMTPIAPRGQPKLFTQEKRDTPIPELATSRDEPVAL